MVEIPDALRDAASQRRLLPFVGAGLSRVAGLPDWSTLLRSLTAEFGGGKTFDELSASCDGDFLRIAEYLVLTAGRRMGPLQKRMIELLATPDDILESTAHVELVNLACRQIYTTNYDSLLEDCHLRLNIDCDVISTPRHVAQASPDRPQVVKFHGDLQYEETLVLTESSYYARLDFETPIDVKLRSDLLGRSVLFLGYSLRDVNLRVMWFRLLRLMSSVSPEDVPPSFILRLSRDAVLEALDRSVGLQTISLDSADDPTNALGDFLTDLSIAIAPDGLLPGDRMRMTVTSGLIRRASSIVDDVQANHPVGESDAELLRVIPRREIPSALREQMRALLTKMTPMPQGGVIDEVRADLAFRYAETFGSDEVSTSALAASRAGNQPLVVDRNRDTSSREGAR